MPSQPAASPGTEPMLADPNNNADTNNNLATSAALPERAVKKVGAKKKKDRDATMKTAWYECDDDIITLLTEEEFDDILSPTGTGSPYLLFYKALTA